MAYFAEGRARKLFNWEFNWGGAQLQSKSKLFTNHMQTVQNRADQNVSRMVRKVQVETNCARNELPKRSKIDRDRSRSLRLKADKPGKRGEKVVGKAARDSHKARRIAKDARKTK